MDYIINGYLVEEDVADMSNLVKYSEELIAKEEKRDDE